MRGNDGQDLMEINNLNHYIGMRTLQESDFVEMKWMPFALGLFALLALRGPFTGAISQVIDLFALFTYFGLFSMGLFYYRLYTYGHELDPKAPMTIEPFSLHYMYSDSNAFARNLFTRNAAGAALMYSKQLQVESNHFTGNRGMRAYGLLLEVLISTIDFQAFSSSLHLSVLTPE